MTDAAAQGATKGSERAHIDPPPVPRNKYALPREALRFMPKLADVNEHPMGWTWPAALDEPPAAWVRELRRLYAEPLAFPASVSPQCGLMVHGLILNLRPRVVVEVGAFVGASTLWIGGAMADTHLDAQPRTGTLHSFDDFGPIQAGPWRDTEFRGDRLELVRGRVRRAGLDGIVEFHKGDSGTELLLAREALRRAGGVDVAYIDGDHSVAGATRDLWAIEPVLNTGGFIILHDTFPEQCGDHLGPRYLLDRVNEIAQGLYERCEAYLSPLNYGLGLLRRIG
jgi:predicted O-methyltransferase YrrM